MKGPLFPNRPKRWVGDPVGVVEVDGRLLTFSAEPFSTACTSSDLSMAFASSSMSAPLSCTVQESSE